MCSGRDEELEAASELCQKFEGRRAHWTLQFVYGLLCPAQKDPAGLHKWRLRRSFSAWVVVLYEVLHRVIVLHF
ncbi:hypothetical protein Y032_0032g2552 [Ancylostoma ceylanicum]|uniref:Uncharacterized protein n=1 Tax=Ancylostoma ceylanicum TaxID=53326 RepID=A0A016UQW2_9BILA|nr:hypothetical protein Y032_0032g2552 [Ancylostoma ceylanicum]